MSILLSNYELSVWKDTFVDGSLQEQKVCTIGSNEMTSQSRAFEINFVRKVNGEKQLTFKMYKQYIDSITGEKVDNYFTTQLLNESKVKLHYKDKWYDFYVKGINENSVTHLCIYSLEDALVQELSKNGFNVEINEALMNNIGDAKELGALALAETDWAVEGEVLVQTVDEALVYITIPSGTKATQIIDQVADANGFYSQGVTTQSVTFGQDITALAFYSSCKNKPHRFQFIYSDKGYDKNPDNSYIISRLDDRSIAEKDCQYYIDFSDPNTAYAEPSEGTGGNGAKSLGLYLPQGFVIGVPGVRKNNLEAIIERDSTLSSWYRGKRYGYSQQAVYVPALKKYCQKFSRNERIITRGKWKAPGNSNSYSSTNGLQYSSDGKRASLVATKTTPHLGLYLDLDYQRYLTYVVNYDLKITGGTLKAIGGHNSSFNASFRATYNGAVLTYGGGKNIDISKNAAASYVLDTALTSGTVKVSATYKPKVGVSDTWPYIYIQPNKYYEDSLTFEITNLTVTVQGDYLGYTDSQFISPTLINNYITNYKFDSNSGWIATQSSSTVSTNKPIAESAYGRFANNNFTTITQDFLDGTYNEENPYQAYLKMGFYNSNQFILNSGPRDNRVLIENMAELSTWILDYRIVTSSGTSVDNNAFECSIGEYLYDTTTGGYSAVNGNISITAGGVTTVGTGANQFKRQEFTVSNNNYNSKTFKENSKLYVKISPKSVSATSETPQIWYLEKMSFYPKHLDSNNAIIVPDYDSPESKSAQEFVDQGKIENTYHYFPYWFVSPDNAEAITDEESLVTTVTNKLTYTTYIPVYNDGAKKVRTIEAKESNYFNILQSIAETFEAWLELEVVRSETGAIQSKIARFKNYIGKDNYANFKYGVNLKDITRTCDSKSIATKLIVKANSNELGQDGFCTIQRAGANPTGENSIYDFQYYFNQGLMQPSDYFNTAYYFTNGDEAARGLDSSLWTNGEVENVATIDGTTLNGYNARVKKINDALIPLNEEIIGLNMDLVDKEASLELAEGQYEAATSGIEQTREDFHALVGLYPEEIQDGSITKIEWPKNASNNPDASLAITSDESWWCLGEITGETFTPKTPSCSGTTVTVPIALTGYEETCDAQVRYGTDVIASNTTQTTEGNNIFEFTKNYAWTGMQVVYDWEIGRQYTLSYTIKLKNNPSDIEDIPEADRGKKGTLINIGTHNAHFSENFKITLTQDGKTPVSTTSNKCSATSFDPEKPIHVEITGRHSIPAGKEGADTGMWIQPNRGWKNEEETERFETITCEISNFKLTKTITPAEAIKNYDRKAKFTLNTVVYVGEKAIPRSYDMTCDVPSGANSVSIDQEITSTDITRSDVQKYIEQYTIYKDTKKTSLEQKGKLETEVGNLQQAIKDKQTYQKNLLKYKSKLNQLFYSKYQRFILEGTWISEEYTDDEKYYTDAQSVLYNSCYPQVAYDINVVFLSKLPGYEDFEFELGDKTWVIDEEFFGPDIRQEIIITEMSETLDDPSKDTLKTQTFKNQFQDLFQKITATVQSAQYSTGAYERSTAFIEANAMQQGAFLTNALNSAKEYLNHGQTVKTGKDGITITDDSNAKRQLKLVGGAILFSATDPETQDTTWRTGLTNEGISADLITAGRLDAGAVQIMSGDIPVFRWDAYGISAYDATWTEANGASIISGINSKKFVRFDKNGIYGINDAPGIDGSSWYPTSLEDIDSNATFALTWKGLKVTGNDSSALHIGKMDDAILKINNGIDDTLLVSKDGDVTIRGTLLLTSGQSVTDHISKELDTFNTEYTKLFEDIQTQVDAKAETWYQSNDPSEEWSQEDYAKHIGDIWHDTTDNTESIWQQIEDGYGWQEMQIPDEVFDKIDGKSNIFVAIPNEGIQINEGDILIPKTDITNGERSYKAGKVYRYTGGGTWEEIEYTDQQTVEELIDALGLPEGAILTESNFKIEQSYDKTTNKTTIIAKNTNGDVISQTVSTEKFVVTNVGFGTATDDHSDTYVILDSEGSFMADNAIISGTIYANAGQIGGWNISQNKQGSGASSGQLTYGSLGASDGFHMYAKDNGVAGTVAGKTVSGTLSSTNPGWMLGIGSNFGVTSDGSVYAKAGKIGGLSIVDGKLQISGSDINFSSGLGTGENVLRYSDFSTKTSSTGITFNGDEVTFSSTTGEVLNFGLNALRSMIEGKGGQTMVISIEYKVNSDKVEKGSHSSTPICGIECSLYSSKCSTNGGNFAWPGGLNLNGSGYGQLPTTKTDGWNRYYKVITLSDAYPLEGLSYNIYFRNYKGSVSFRHPQLEFGTIPTAWNMAADLEATTAANITTLTANTAGITADALTREGEGYRFRLTAANGFQVDSRASKDSTNWNNVMTVDDKGLNLKGAITCLAGSKTVIKSVRAEIGDSKQYSETFTAPNTVLSAKYRSGTLSVHGSAIVANPTVTYSGQTITVTTTSNTARTEFAYELEYSYEAANQEVFKTETDGVSIMQGRIGKWVLSDTHPDDNADGFGAIYYDGWGYGSGGYEHYRVRITPKGIELKYAGDTGDAYEDITWGQLVRMVRNWLTTPVTSSLIGGQGYY